MGNKGLTSRSWDTSAEHRQDDKLADISICRPTNGLWEALQRVGGSCLRHQHPVKQALQTLARVPEVLNHPCQVPGVPRGSLDRSSLASVGAPQHRQVTLLFKKAGTPPATPISDGTCVRRPRCRTHTHEILHKHWRERGPWSLKNVDGVPSGSHTHNLLHKRGRRVS